MFCVVFFRLLDVNAVVRRDRVQLSKSSAQFFQLLELLVPGLFCLVIFGF